VFSQNIDFATSYAVLFISQSLRTVRTPRAVVRSLQMLQDFNNFHACKKLKRLNKNLNQVFKELEHQETTKHQESLRV